MNSEVNLNRLQAALCGSSFRHFVEYFWPVVSGDKFKAGLVVDALCEHLQAVRDGRIKRLAIAVPIRHGKSLITSVLFPAWLWVHDPSLRILTVSNGERLALRDSLRTRQLMESGRFQSLFGKCFTFDKSQDAKGFYQNDRKGTRVALGTGSNTNGQDADVIIADDILDYHDAASSLERQNAVDYWEGTLTQRLALGNNKDRLLLVGHRVHEEDVFAHVFNCFGNGGEWSYLVLPAEAQPGVTNGYHNAINWTDERLEGELLNPERFPRDVIESKKKELRHKYYCLFQQDPAPAAGELFKKEWFRQYAESDGCYLLTHDGQGHSVRTDKAWRFGTVDTAVTTSRDSDYTVCQVWDVVGQDLVLVHQMRKKLDGSRLIPALAEVVKLYAPQFLLVEQEFVGQFVIDQLRALGIPVKKYRARNNKERSDKASRAIAAEIRMEAGRVWFPKEPWVADLMREVLSFPKGAHDDQVDALSMACSVADRYYGKLQKELTEDEVKEQSAKKREEQFARMVNADDPFIKSLRSSPQPAAPR